MLNKLGDIYTDLWGGSEDQKPAAPVPLADGAKKTDNCSGKPDGSSGKPDVPRIDTGEIERLNSEINKELEKDFGNMPVKAAAEKEEKEQPKTDPMEELNALVGLTELKSDVKELISFVKMQKMRRESGLKTVPVSLHLVFTGNPGTGKTTVARILAQLYKEIGALSKGQLVEADRSALVAGYVGQTAIKTQEKITQALGGVLFIDEAYTLANGGANDFGQECIDTILKAMEDHRDDFVVIVAGYPDLMKNFINSNPGLKSRFNKYFYFPDYNVQELTSIFQGMCRKYDYKPDEEAQKAIEEHIEKIVREKDENFANARSVRNLFEKIVTNQANRIAQTEKPSYEEMTTVLAEDIDGI